ncbi:MAG: restriction endonuclease [Chloroflexi bacterium]|nr:restriction endonuclease [Chloroflexota bacterium]
MPNASQGGSSGAPWLLIAGLPSLAAAIYVAEKQPLLAVAVGGLVVMGLALWLVIWRRRCDSWKIRARTLGELLALTPPQFELAVATLLADLGYRDVRHIGGAGDLSADVICRDKRGRDVVVQCKRHAPGIRVGSGDVQAFIGMMTVHHRAEQGIFVTTSAFSKPAAELAAAHQLQLIDGDELTRLIERTQRRRSRKPGASP